ncbi:MAG: CBS domain-containing protein [Pseudomonadales bacterium]|nr:CBS domain-containing protein [Pseudomonadales bacterium]
MDIQFFSQFDQDSFLTMEAPVSVIEKFLSRSQHTFVPVVDDGGSVFGVVTALDVINFLSSGGNAQGTKAWEICSHNIVRCRPETPISEMAKMMLENRVHHLLVEDSDEIIGVVSSFDLLRHISKAH